MPIENMAFTMPDADVTIIPTYHKLENGEYSIETSVMGNNGTVTTDMHYARAGATVHISAVPEDGCRTYYLAYGYWAEENGERIWKEVTIEGDSFMENTKAKQVNVNLYTKYNRTWNRST